MNKLIFLLVLIVLTKPTFSQTITKPIGCFAGTNGTNSAVLSHVEARGVLLTETWKNIEQTPGVYNFSTLINKINTVKAAGLKYSLAIPAGAFGSPDWLIDSLNAGYHSFVYQSQTLRLPLWWDSICEQKMTELITEIGIQFASDTHLSHVYVSQMTTNGVEGHLNGVNMTTFATDGFTNQKWIDAARTTTYNFANAFPDKPIVFEVHEIDHDTLVPATLMNGFFNDPSLCDRVGLGMWWISGKTTYQPNLIDFIYHFEGDKYAQIIGRSDQNHRFKDSLYSTIFSQAKHLNIRYIEPWPYEFQYHTYDSLITDFNEWADSNFSPTHICAAVSINENLVNRINEPSIYPNPTDNIIRIKIDFNYQDIEAKVYDIYGKIVLTTMNKTELILNELPKGIYFLELKIDNKTFSKKIIKN